jgi:signal transducing adaptor molecule
VATSHLKRPHSRIINNASTHRLLKVCRGDMCYSRWNAWLMYMYIEPQYPTQSPSPNYQRPNNNNAAPPFYMAGAEVPPQGGPPQPQQPQHSRPDQGQRIPSGGKQPMPIQTSSPPPSNNPYAAYQGPGAGQRPQYGGAPQELSTSVYDSPIAPHNPQSAGGATYTSSVYSPDEMYHASPAIGSVAPNTNAPSAPGPSAPAPSAPDNRHSYQPYTSYSQPPQQHYGHGYDGGANDPPHPPAPTGQAPPPPIPQARPENVMTPPPLQPSGSAYDARQTLPSSRLYSSPPPQQRPDAGQQQQQQAPQQPQYKAYVPPGASAPASDGPSGPGDYYRTAAY